MPKYTVQDDANLLHDGKPYGPGDEVEMTEAQAMLLGSHIMPAEEETEKKAPGKKGKEPKVPDPEGTDPEADS